MNNDFEYMILSIFHDCEFDEFTDMVLNDSPYKRDIKKGYIDVKSDVLNISQYFNPVSGNHFEKCSWWSNKNYPKTVFLMSNIRANMTLVSGSLRCRLDCPLTLIKLSQPGPNEDMYWFEHFDRIGRQRLVFALIENKRWVYFDTGEPLPFENLDYYKRRIIKQRINFDIIVEYLSKMGINLWDIDSEVTQCMTFERTAWE